MNKGFVQLRGPFAPRQELVAEMKRVYGTEFKFISELGISAPKDTMISVNGKEMKIGKTEMLEFQDVEIKEIYFLEAVGSSATLDCLVR